MEINFHIQKRQNTIARTSKNNSLSFKENIDIHEISFAEGKSIAYSYECKFIETSAAINHNVDELLVGVVSQIRLKNKQKEGLRQNKTSASPSKSKGFSSPRRLHGGSMKGSLRSSLKTKGLINRLLGKSGRSKSCDNLHVL